MIFEAVIITRTAYAPRNVVPLGYREAGEDRVNQGSRRPRPTQQ